MSVCFVLAEGTLMTWRQTLGPQNPNWRTQTDNCDIRQFGAERCLPGLRVIWGQGCPKMAAGPCLPNGPITQLSPWVIRKPGISCNDVLANILVYLYSTKKDSWDIRLPIASCNYSSDQVNRQRWTISLSPHAFHYFHIFLHSAPSPRL